VAADDHIRQQTLDAAKAKLASAVALVDQRVWLTPRPPVSKKEAPGIVLAQGDEDVEYGPGEPDRVLNRYFDLDVIMFDVIKTDAGANSNLLASLNAMGVQVEKAMVPATKDGAGLGIGELDIRFLRTARPQASALGDDLGEIVSTVRIVLPTVEGDPTRSIYAQQS
jgi:hypothetical protein